MLTLNGIAHYPQIGTNLVSLRKLREKGYWWDQENNTDTIRHSNGQVLCDLKQYFDQYVLEYTPISESRASFAANHLRYNSWTSRKPSKATAMQWHRRLGHPGPRTLEHLMNSTLGVRIKGPLTVECDICALTKIKRQEHHEARKPSAIPRDRISINFHDFPKGISGYTSYAIITDRCTGFIWDYYFANRQEESLLIMLKHQVKLLDHRYNMRIRVIETDNELQKSNQIRVWLNQSGIQVEESAPRTQQQNGSAERSGGVVKEKARLLSLGSNLPAELWPEMVRTAVYLLNRSPKQRLKWKTPYERFFSTFRGSPDDAQPRITHLKNFGCKAFVMTKNAQLKAERLKSRLSPKAWIGFLVGYNSQNIFRIWNPITNCVYITRDVIFNKEEFFSSDDTYLSELIRETTLEEIKDRLEALSNSKIVDQVQAPVQGDDELETQDSSLEQPIEDLESGDAVQEEEEQSNEKEYTQLMFEPLPTPPESPAAAFLSHSIESGKERGRQFKSPLAFEQAFYAGTLAVPIGKNGNTVLTKASQRRCGRGKSNPKWEAHSGSTNLKPSKIKFHITNLPAPPKSHYKLEGHRFEKEFKIAKASHLESHQAMESWKELSSSDSSIRNTQILNCIWVYTYKLNNHGYLLKCKARLVVRGDQQQKASTEDTYTSTLAAKSFRTFLAIAARFDLEL